MLDAHVDKLSFLGDTFVIKNVELTFLKRRRHLVLNDLDTGLVSQNLVTFLYGTDPTDVEPHRGIELERIAARCGFGVTEHHADLHTDLVDKDHHRI